MTDKSLTIFENYQIRRYYDEQTGNLVFFGS